MHAEGHCKQIHSGLHAHKYAGAHLDSLAGSEPFPGVITSLVLVGLLLILSGRQCPLSTGPLEGMYMIPLFSAAKQTWGLLTPHITGQHLLAWQDSGAEWRRSLKLADGLWLSFHDSASQRCRQDISWGFQSHSLSPGPPSKLYTEYSTPNQPTHSELGTCQLIILDKLWVQILSQKQVT